MKGEKWQRARLWRGKPNYRRAYHEKKMDRGARSDGPASDYGRLCGEHAGSDGAPVQAETTAEPQHNLTVTTKYRYFISQYRYIRERKVSYFDNVYAYNHGEYSLTPFDSTVRKNTSSPTKAGTLAIAPIVLDITDAMRERLYGADMGETALYYGQYCERKKDRKGVWGYTGIHEGIDFVNVKGAPLYAILGWRSNTRRRQERHRRHLQRRI